MTTKDCVYRHRYIYKNIFKYLVSETEDECCLKGKRMFFTEECKKCKSYASRYGERK